MKNLKPQLFTFFAGMLFSISTVANVPEQPTPELLELAPLPEYRETTKNIVAALNHRHYIRAILDDDVSELIFNSYLSDIDPSKSYLLAEDIKSFSKFRLELDNALRRGDIEPAFIIFNRYQEKVILRLEKIITLLETGTDQFNFDQDETLELDRKEAAWAASESELDDLWRRRIKNDVLNLRLAKKESQSISELLLKRYKNRLKRTRQIRSEDVYQLFMNAFTKTYDPHTQYFSPTTSENFNINMSLSLEGIGAVLEIEDEYTKVVSLVPAGPADKAKQLQPNDFITSVGQGLEGEMVNVIGWRLDDVVQLIRGKKDTIVRLEILSSNSADSSLGRIIQITRNKVNLEEQSAQSDIIEIEQAGETKRIGVIDIPTFYIDFQALQNGDPFYRSTTRDVRNLLLDLQDQNVDAVVIDLRNNGGGSLQEAKTLTGLFIDRGPTVQIRSKADRVDILSDRDIRITYEGPLAVLVNRLSASASEIFAGAIQDYNRGLVLGTQTFGKGTVQSLQALNKGQLKMTQAKFYRITGESTQHKGIIPDIQYPSSYDPESIGESTLERPLPWDKIKAAKFRLKPSQDSILSELTQRHLERTTHDPDFIYLTDAFKYKKARSELTSVSLNETARRAQQAESKAFWLGLTNKKRVAQGLPEIASLDELDMSSDEEPAAEAPSSSNEASTPTSVEEPLDRASALEQVKLVDVSINAEPPILPSSDNSKPAEDDEVDAYLVETGHILIDYISLMLPQQEKQTARSPI
jgi:carboxyl-terminal processing protease